MGMVGGLHPHKVQTIRDSADVEEKKGREKKGRAHHSEPDFHHWTKIRPVVLERYRVDDDYDSGRGGVTKEYTVDGLVRVFEGMKDEFGISEIFEVKVWA